MTLNEKTTQARKIVELSNKIFRLEAELLEMASRLKSEDPPQTKNARSLVFHDNSRNGIYLSYSIEIPDEHIHDLGVVIENFYKNIINDLKRELEKI